MYALLCPDSGDVRYIGKANNSQKRLKSHLRDATRRRTPVYDWILSLRKKGLEPLMRVLCVVDDCVWREMEIALIANAKAKGHRLLNLARGGDEPYCPTEVRRRNGIMVARKIHDDPVKKRVWSLKRAMGQAIQKGYITESALNKLRLAAKKRPDLFSDLLHNAEIAYAKK